MLAADALLQLKHDFHPPWYIKSPLLQTIWGVVFKKKLLPHWQYHELPLADGDCHECAMIGDHKDPVIIMVPGMGGSWRSAAVANSVSLFLQQGWQVAVLNHRGFGRHLNRLAKITHGGATEDLTEGIAQIQTLRPGVRLYGLGFSLGASQMLNYLARCSSLLTAVCAISTPFDLSVAEKVTPPLYQRYILQSVRSHYLQKIAAGVPLPIDREEVRGLATFRQLDQLITAPLHGFSNVDEYYRKSSCLPVLHQIKTPSLLLSASDDPFYPKCYLQPVHAQLNDMTSFLELKEGGHLGFWARGASARLEPYWVQITDLFFKSLSS